MVKMDARPAVSELLSPTAGATTNYHKKICSIITSQNLMLQKIVKLHHIYIYFIKKERGTFIALISSKVDRKQLRSICSTVSL